MNSIKKNSKLLRLASMNKSAATNTNVKNDLTMKSNEAYGTVSAQYEEVQFHCRRSQGERNEFIYDQLAL